MSYTIHSFKGCHSMAFSMYTELCLITTPIREHFQHPKKTPHHP